MINLVAKSDEEILIKKYLEQNASESLKNKINAGKKTLKGFMDYAAGEARKSAKSGCNYACIKNDVVYGWAIHYFEEDEIKEGKIKENNTKRILKQTKVTKVDNNDKNNQLSIFEMGLI